MSVKKEFKNWIEVKEKDGNIARYSVSKKGRSVFIKNENGYEHLMHPSAQSIKDEIRIVFEAEMIRTILPGQK